RIDGLALGGPAVLVRAADPGIALGRIGGAARAREQLADVTRRAILLAAHAGDACAVRVLQLDAEVIEDVAERRVHPRLPAAHAVRAHGRSAERPVRDVDVV